MENKLKGQKMISGRIDLSRLAARTAVYDNQGISGVTPVADAVRNYGIVLPFDPEDVPFEPDTESMSEYEMNEREREERRPNHPHLD